MTAKGIIPTDVVVLSVSDEALIERVCGRRLGSDGKIYHIKYNPPPEGLEVTQRDDDTEETAGKRIQTYKDNFAPIIAQYAPEIIKTIDGNGAPADVAIEVIKALRGEGGHGDGAVAVAAAEAPAAVATTIEAAPEEDATKAVEDAGDADGDTTTFVNAPGAATNAAAVAVDEGDTVTQEEDGGAIAAE